jgi:hypothetical protein
MITHLSILIYYLYFMMILKMFITLFIYKSLKTIINISKHNNNNYNLKMNKSIFSLVQLFLSIFLINKSLKPIINISNKKKSLKPIINIFNIIVKYKLYTNNISYNTINTIYYNTCNTISSDK